MDFTPYPYQDRIADEMVSTIRHHGCVYLAAEVRTGKTLMSLLAAERLGANRVIMLTVKKAIPGIKKDIELFISSLEKKRDFSVDVLSIDSAHKIDKKYDLFIIDEAHGLATYPKKNKRAKEVSKHIKKQPVIFLSGTPNPETLVQLFHQFSVTEHGPWVNTRNFYEWAKAGYVNIKQRRFAHGLVNDYSEGVDEKIRADVDKYFINFSQSDAEFECPVHEHVVHVKMNKHTMEAIALLKKDKVISSAGYDILGDNPAKLLGKVHQMCSGTVIDEDGNSHIFDTSKVDYIKKRWRGKKLVIFYKYTAELTMLREEFGTDITTEIEVFDNTSKHIALQIRAGSQGVNLSKGDIQIVLTPDFSSKDRIQSRARMQKRKGRDRVDVYYIFSEGGVEDEIWKILQTKEKYTSAYFKERYFK